MPLDRDQVIRLLQERNATKPCSRCGKSNFSIIDQYSTLNLQDEVGGALRIGGPNVPVALVACTNCGAITAHALGALGMLPQKEEE